MNTDEELINSKETMSGIETVKTEGNPDFQLLDLSVFICVYQWFFHSFCI